MVTIHHNELIAYVLNQIKGNILWNIFLETSFKKWSSEASFVYLQNASCTLRFTDVVKEGTMLLHYCATLSLFYNRIFSMLYAYEMYTLPKKFWQKIL